MNDNTFLPNDYEVPVKSGNYMRFQEGENRFRILSSPIIGWEAWEEKGDGTRKPIRRPMDKPFNIEDIEKPEEVKHFWAMPVYNYQEERVQILEITQKGLQKSIRALAKDEDWGSPTEYDLVVTREGKELDTKYTLNPKPAKKIDSGILKLYEDMRIDLTALYRGEDPFVQPEIVEKKV